MLEYGVYNIDCKEGFKLIEDTSLDYVFTSPPYGRKRNDVYEHFDDRMDWYSLIDMTISESLRVLKDNGYLILNIQKNYYNKKDYFKLIGKYADYICEEVIWAKSNPRPAIKYSVTNGYEVFLILNPKGTPIKANKLNVKNYFISSGNRNKYKGHSAVMSIDACRYMFENFIKEDSIVLDCFSGLATTGVVCKEFNCHYIGFEIAKKYYDDSLERLNNS